MQSGLENPLRATTAGTLLGAASTRVLLIEGEGEATSLSALLATTASVIKVASQENAWEKLLLDRSFDAVVCNVQATYAESVSLIAAIRASITQRIAKLAIFTIEPFAAVEPSAPTDWVKLGASGHFAGGLAVESLQLALYGPNSVGPSNISADNISPDNDSPDKVGRTNASAAKLQSEHTTKLQASEKLNPSETSLPRANPISSATAIPTQAVRDWLKDRFNPNDGWLILHGALEQRVMGETGPRRPSRLAIIQQYLRRGDELLVEDERLFWIAVRVNDELLGARLALRIALKLMRSSDPGRLPIAVAISGSCLSENPEAAVDLCRRNLPVVSQAGDVSIAIDRWRFSLPIRVAQTLLLG